MNPDAAEICDGIDNRADVTCDGVVNLMDKLKVRQQFGQTGGCGCQ
ncbi:MAG: hypothetical protein HZA16_11345 [Nitrospirae bacterium]|nr:hypothetical protein [Nitrospirota bacterium]